MRQTLRNSPDARVKLRRSGQRLVVHHHPVWFLSRQRGHGPVSPHCAVTIESAVIGRGLGRGVDGAGALVDGGAHRAHGAHPHGAAPASPVNGGQRHVGVLVLDLPSERKIDRSFLMCDANLNIFGLVLEVNPGVRVAPNEDREEEGADDGRHQHDEQTKQSLSTGSIQGVIVKSKQRLSSNYFLLYI